VVSSLILPLYIGARVLKPVLLKAVRAAAKLGVEVHEDQYESVAASFERECLILRERHGADSGDAAMASMVLKVSGSLGVFGV